jgi:hypothetical protein
MIAPRIVQTAMQPVPQLQHSKEFVEEEDPAIVRQTPVIKGDSEVSRRSSHAAFYFTKSAVKGNLQKVTRDTVIIGAN